MKIEALIRILAGSMILLSVALAHFVSPWWLWLTCFVGVNLIQSALTGFCPPSFVLKKLGWLGTDGIVRCSSNPNR
ncbi:MAG: DUF2892 domain-containing protein [Opitutaceae bacterium]|nr:DUF2892 domain-containing protein [Opitutaceae bacterium]MBP9914502.1 DUF2892 domain-containing protein [Opitutaceae bacterium]